MLLHNLENREAGGYTTFGSVWSKGEVAVNSFTLCNGRGEAVPMQTKITARWPDGSVKWAAHTANSERMNNSVSLEPCSGEAVHDKKIEINETAGFYIVDTGRLVAKIPTEAMDDSCLTEEIVLDGVPLVKNAYPVFWDEKRCDETVRCQIERTLHKGLINKIVLEERGELQCVFRFDGFNIGGEKPSMPFIIRMYLWLDSPEIRFTHTFLYDGAEERDYLAGMGIRFDSYITGKSFNRHIKFALDRDKCFNEAAVMLWSRIPRIDNSVLEAQMNGKIFDFTPDSVEIQAEAQLPHWNKFSLLQDSPTHFSVKKGTGKGCCEIEAKHGLRAPGVMCVTGETGGLMLGIRDFWQKYPSGLEVDGLAAEPSCTAWFYSPDAPAMDFRHYSTESYQLTSYEGFDFFGASAYGIGVTSECTIRLTERIPADEEINVFAKRMQKPPVYVGTPEYYYEKRAFGQWSLPCSKTQAEAMLEKHLEKIAEYYIDQVEQCNWYGLFNYGDFMHTYDSVRHCWKYDVGGFAWDNTELVPTYWLWMYFLRTGREDIYTIAEALSRHCSEVDVYHFGALKGLGSRHNVRHWGCSCKEPRVAMAGHHRFLYYLTGDNRIGDVMDDVKDADFSLENVGYYAQKDREEKMTLCIRSGPDWSSFVSNWMTRYERYSEKKYRAKIEKGIESIKASPLGLVSGPSFEYNKNTGELIYAGESVTGDTHLQICMGAPQIWTETADMLENDMLKHMIADYGKFYMLTPEEKNKRSGGLIGDRPFSLPYMASAISAYAAACDNNAELARTVWRVLLKAAEHGVAENSAANENLFDAISYDTRSDGKQLTEIPVMSTNFAAQWCLNVIVTLDLIREYLPDTPEKLKTFLNEPNPGIYVRP